MAKVTIYFYIGVYTQKSEFYVSPPRSKSLIFLDLPQGPLIGEGVIHVRVETSAQALDTFFGSYKRLKNASVI